MGEEKKGGEIPKVEEWDFWKSRIEELNPDPHFIPDWDPFLIGSATFDDIEVPVYSLYKAVKAYQTATGEDDFCQALSDVEESVSYFPHNGHGLPVIVDDV